MFRHKNTKNKMTNIIVITYFATGNDGSNKMMTGDTFRKNSSTISPFQFPIFKGLEE